MNTLKVSANPALLGKCHQIAAMLGDGWTYQPKENHAHWATFAELTHTSGMGISLQIEDSKPSRMNVSGTFPRGQSLGEYLPRGGSHSISLSSSKTAEQIAADIKRRFLPIYEEQFTEASARKAQHDDFERNMDATRRRFQARGLDFKSGPGMNTDTTEHLSRGFAGYGTVRICGPDSIDIHTRGISTDMALRILEILAEG